MSATPFADQRTTAGDTGILSSRIIYNFCFCKPLCTPSVSTGVRRVPLQSPAYTTAPLVYETERRGESVPH